MSLLKIEHANYSYPQSKKLALDDVSINVERGDYIALLGTNGSGKSTLARLMAGFFECDSGSFSMEEGVLPGIVFQQPKEQIVAGVVERDTAFGPQNLNMSKGEIELRSIECLSVVGLADRASSRTFELSLGQTQRLAFSGILALFPDLLILDEVTAMLDPKARLELVQFIDQWNAKGHTVIHVTHDEDEALRAKRIVAMESGRVIFDGSREEFARSTEVIDKVFGLERGYNFAKKTPEEYEALPVSLEVKDLSFAYKDRSVFSNVSFSLKKGTVTAVTGPSGCGKSTMFECLSGLLKTTGGTIEAVSRPVLALQESEASLFETYAADDVAFGPSKQGVSGKKLVNRVKKSMELAGLSYKDFADRGTFYLSGGEKRKLSIAGIIALDKDIMIFDEPTSALDCAARRVVLKTLRTLADQGKTVLFSTHRMEEVEIADQNLRWEEINPAGQKEIKASEAMSDRGSSSDKGKKAVKASGKKSHVERVDAAIPPDNRSKTSEKVSDGDDASGESSSGLKLLEPMANASLLESVRNVGGAFVAPPEIPSSVISRLPPLVKYLVFLTLFIGSMVVYPVWLCALLLGLNLVYAMLSKYGFKRPFKAFAKLLPWIVFFAIFQFIFYPVQTGEPVIYKLGWIVITSSKLVSLGRMFLRACCIILSIGSFVYTTDERQILDGLSALLTPLALIKVPVRYAVLVVGIIFRFVPLLLDELNGILKTQMMRGNFGEVKGFSRIKIMIPLFVPLLLQTFRKAQFLADALTARYF